MRTVDILRLVAATAIVLLAFGAATAGDIPDRPEDLRFPELKYDPPVAKDYRTDLANGMTAYLVPDPALPLVTVHVLMRLGPDHDPAGQAGLGNLMMGQLTSGGAGGLTAEQMEDQLAALGATLSSGMGGGRRGMMGMGGVRTGPAESYVSLNLLAKDLDVGLGLLIDCLKEPAFQADRLELAREQLLQRMKERNDDSADIEGREWGYLMHGADHWTTHWPTQASLESITRDDLLAMHRRWVGPQNFILAVSGDFEKKAMKQALERAFADWPYTAESTGLPAAPAHEPPAGWFLVDKEVNQARVTLGMRAIDRYDPDWYAAQVMNEILGAGGFSSRLVNRIRSDEGLAYSVRSSLGQGTYYPDEFRVTFQTKVRSTAYAVSIALAEIERIRDEPVSDEELELAKAGFIESLPASFETAGSIASALALEEVTGRYQRDAKHYKEYRERISQVTLGDVQRVAQRLLDVERMAFLVVGDVDEVLLGDPKHDVNFDSLGGGAPTMLPLRDPMTLRPVGE